MPDKPTCWTCPSFIYSGELDVGDCLVHGEMKKENDVCEEHPEWRDPDIVHEDPDCFLDETVECKHCGIKMCENCGPITGKGDVCEDCESMGYDLEDIENELGDDNE